MRSNGSPPEPYDAVVLAGGASRRMGQDKPALYVGRRTLLDRVLSAVADAARVVVVGPERHVDREVFWAQEDPPGSGPVAALAAGLRHVTAPCTVVLAADLPFVTPATVQSLLSVLRPPYAGAVLVDDVGRDQYLCSGWRTEALRQADLSVDRLGRLVSQLPYDRIQLPDAPGSQPAWMDCDTPEDLAVARGLA